MCPPAGVRCRVPALRLLLLLLCAYPCAGTGGTNTTTTAPDDPGPGGGETLSAANTTARAFDVAFAHPALTAARRTAVAAVVAGAVAGSPCLALRLAAVSEACGGGDPAVRYGTVLSPLQLDIAGDRALGAVLGNLLVAGAVLGGSFSLAYVLRRWGADLCPSVCEGIDPAAVAMFPTLPLMAYQLLAQGLLLAAGDLIANPAGTALSGGSPILGVIVVFAHLTVLGVLLQAARTHVPAAAHVRAERGSDTDRSARGYLRRVLVGRGEWVSTHPRKRWAERWSCLLRPYDTHTPWWLSVDLLASLAVALPLGPRPHTPRGCGTVRVVLACIFSGGLCAELVWRPHLAPRAAMGNAFVLGAIAGGLALQAAGYFATDPDVDAGAFAVGGSLLLWASVFAAARSFLDVMVRIYVMATGRRERLQREAFEDSAPPTAGKNDDATSDDEACVTLVQVDVDADRPTPEESSPEADKSGDKGGKERDTATITATATATTQDMSAALDRCLDPPTPADTALPHSPPPPTSPRRSSRPHPTLTLDLNGSFGGDATHATLPQAPVPGSPGSPRLPALHRPGSPCMSPRNGPRHPPLPGEIGSVPYRYVPVSSFTLGSTKHSGRSVCASPSSPTLPRLDRRRPSSPLMSRRPPARDGSPRRASSPTALHAERCASPTRFASPTRRASSPTRRDPTYLYELDEHPLRAPAAGRGQRRSVDATAGARRVSLQTPLSPL